MNLESVIVDKLKKLLENCPVSFAEIVTKSRKEKDPKKTGNEWLTQQCTKDCQRFGLAVNGSLDENVRLVVLDNVRGRGTKLYVKELTNDNH